MRIKYTKELLSEAVKHSESVYDVLRYLGISVRSGSSHCHIKKKIAGYEIDISHFLGIRKNSGSNHKGGRRKRTPREILIIKDDDEPKEKSVVLRNALIDIGREYKCQSCGLPPMWNNKPLRLHVDHIDGNTADNREINLRFLCPNCHNQTENHSIIKHRVAKEQKFCADCKIEIYKNNKTGYCYKCVQKHRQEWKTK